MGKKVVKPSTKSVPKGSAAKTDKRPKLVKQPTSQAPSLLSLAPELRTKIWEYALVEAQPIRIRNLRDKYRTTTGQPALLTTCRQIRKETVGMWYGRNKFLFSAASFDFAPYLKFCRLLRKYSRDPTARVSCKTRGGIHSREVLEEDLDDLKDWLKLYHKNPDLVPCLPQDSPAFFLESRTLAVRTFGMVLNMRNQPWDTVSGVLDSIFISIVVAAARDRDALEAGEEGYDTDEGDLRRCLGIEYSGESDYSEDDEDFDLRDPGEIGIADVD